MAQPQPSLQGVIAPLFTPFHEDGSLDADGLGNLVRHLAATRLVPTVFLRSGLGQMWQYRREDFERALQAAAAAAEGRVALFVNASGFWNGDPESPPEPQGYLAECRSLAREAASLGAHGIVLVLPYMLAWREGPPPEEITRRFLLEVAEATTLPILLYQAPSVPKGFWLTADLLARLLEEVPHLAGVKLSNHHLEQYRSLLQAAEGTGFAVICGDETVWLQAAELGSCGVIGEGCNTYPGLLAAVRERLARGDREGAERAQEAVHRCLAAVQGLDAAVLGKQLLQRQGVSLQPYGRLRPAPLPRETVDRVVAEHAAAFHHAGVDSPYPSG